MLKLDKFRNPDREYQAVALWGWTDRMQDQEIMRQIADMDAHGWGGFFMGTRFGLETPYLSAEWMDRTATAVAEAKKRGMKAWLYDEDIFPSGFAGGLVTTKRPDYRMKALVCREHGQYREFAEGVRVFLARRVDGELQDVVPLIGPPPDPEPGRVFLHFYEWTQGARHQDQRWRWHTWSHGNGFPVADVLNPQVIRDFIDVTYEPYYERFGQEFGTTVPGSFADEPGMDYASSHVGIEFHVPWTPGVPAYFAGRTGYSVLDHLPSLFYDVGDYGRVRYDFWRAMTSLFVESYSKQIGDWCAAHNLHFTGHYLAEETLAGQLPHNGAVMPHYEYQGVVGVEKLGEDVHGVNYPFNDRLTLKQADSVACQLAKPRLMCETGLTRQQATVEARKWVGDWLYLLGVNLLESAICDYSLRGSRKRDWSPRHSWHQPWWRWNGLTEDYFSRLSYALTQGRRVVEILVIHPIASAWVAYRPQGTYEAEALDHALADLVLGLLQMHRDYHFGDEMIMERHARVEDGRLWIGVMPYQVVIVPPSITLSASTARLLREFAEQGGTVIVCEPLPTLVDGRPVPDDGDRPLPSNSRIVPAGATAPVSAAFRDRRRMSRESYAFTVDLTRLEQELGRVLPADVALDEAPWIWYHHRRTESGDTDQHIYFLTNTSPDTAWSGTVRLAGEGAVEEWDPHTGQATPLYCRSSDDYTEVYLAFPEAGSHLLVLTPGTMSQVGEAPVPTFDARELALADNWHARRVFRENALTLDYARFCAGRGPWSERLPLWRVYEALRNRWMESDFELEYAFDVAEAPEGPVHLVVEVPTWWQVSLNGQQVAHTEGEQWFDVSMRRVEITPLVREGANIVGVKGRFARGTDVENCYVIGDFAVEMPSRRIEREPDEVRCGDLVAQGYPFFAGIIALTQQVDVPDVNERAFLVLDGLQATMAFIRINGHDAGPIAFHPHEIEVTSLLQPGENTVEVQLVGCVQNLLGPHHYEGGEPYLNLDMGDVWASSSSWTDDYECAPLGLAGARIVWRAPAR